MYSIRSALQNLKYYSGQLRLTEGLRNEIPELETLGQALGRPVLVRRPRHEQDHQFQINHPTRGNSSSSLLLDVYAQFNMFRASLRPSSGAKQLQ